MSTEGYQTFWQNVTVLVLDKSKDAISYQNNLESFEVLQPTVYLKGAFNGQEPLIIF